MMIYRKVEGLDYDFKESFNSIMQEVVRGMIDVDEAKSIFDETLKIGLIQCDDRADEVRAWHRSAMSFLEQLEQF
jgi:hypothetical protein